MVLSEEKQSILLTCIIFGILLSFSYLMHWTPNQNYTVYATGMYIGGVIYNFIFLWKYYFSNSHTANKSSFSKAMSFIWFVLFFSLLHLIFYFGVGMDMIADMDFYEYIVLLPELIKEHILFIIILAVYYIPFSKINTKWHFDKHEPIWGGMGVLFLGISKIIMGAFLACKGYANWMPIAFFVPISLILYPIAKKTTPALKKWDKKLEAEQKQKKYFVKAKRVKRRSKGVFFEKRSAPILYEGKRPDIDFSDMYNEDN